MWHGYCGRKEGEGLDTNQGVQVLNYGSNSTYKFVNCDIKNSLPKNHIQARKKKRRFYLKYVINVSIAGHYLIDASEKLR